MNRLLTSVAVSLLSVAALTAQAQVVVVPVSGAPSGGGIAVGGPGIASPQALALQAQDISGALHHHGYRLNARELTRIQTQLDRVADLLARSGIPLGGGGVIVPPGGPVVVTPPAYAMVYSATCRIDDDRDLSSGAETIGSLRSADVLGLLNECQQIAQSRHGAFGYSAIANLRVDNAPRDYVLATCRIDDDRDLSSGATTVGTLAAPSYLDAQRQCEQIARSVHGSFGYAAVNLVSYAP